MSMTRFALRHRPVTIALLLLVSGVGLLATQAMPRREDPDIPASIAQIVALYPGATTPQVESLVTEKLERTLMAIDEIKTVESTSRAGVAVLRVTTSERARDRERLWDVVRKRVADLREALPSGVVAIQVNDRFFAVAAFIFGVTWDGATDRQREAIARKVRDRLLRLPDVAEATLLGEQQERITLSLSAQRMAQLAVPPSRVSAAIAGRNVLPSAGGSLRLGDTRLAIAPTGHLRDERDLADLLIAPLPAVDTGDPAAAPSETPVYLRDIATITREYADPSPFLVRVNGKPAVAVSLTMRQGRNITVLGAKVEAALAELRAGLPPGAALTVLNDLPRSVARRIGEFFTNLVAGLVLIFLVMYLFMGLRSALIVGAMLPLTVLGTFAAMLTCGREIQQISIAALIIALGLVVDNSIVVIDNIERKLSEGIEREQAAIEGADEISLPLLTSNLTTIASFAPVLLLSGDVGGFVRDLGIVTTLATLVSLLLNYTVAPLVALRFLERAEHDTPNRLRRAFHRLVERLRDGGTWLAERGLRRPALTVGLATMAMLGAIASIPRLGTQFFPAAERNQFRIDVWLPEGRDIRATRGAVGRVEQILAHQPGIVSYVAYIGQGGPRFFYNVSPEPPAPNYAQIVVNSRGIAETRRLVAATQRATDATVTDARVIARALEQGPPIGAPVAVRLSGDDVGTLRALGEHVHALLDATPGTTSVYHDYGERTLSLQVKVDGDRAALLGLSSADVAQATQMGFMGLTVSYLRQGDKEIPIQLRLAAAEREGAESLEDLYLPTRTGAVVPLRQVAAVALAPEEGRILRRNHVRTLTVYAFADGTRLPSAILADVRRKIAATELPRGYQVSYGGEEEEMTRSFTEMLGILGLAVAANLIIVLWEFNSAAIAFTIMAAVPFALTGAILGLFVTHQAFGLMAFLGITSLAGVVTNHTIVLFEYAAEEQRRGHPLEAALIEAGRKRLRPILLTVTLSIGGLLPQAVNGGTLWPPMAWGLIFGLLASLVLTIVVVPSLYKLLRRPPA